MEGKHTRWLAILLALTLLLPSGLLAPIAKAETQANGNIVYHETFESGLGVAVPAGTANLAAACVVFEGNEDGYAVHITERSANWHGMDIPFSSVGMENGKTYTITVKGYVASGVDVPDGAIALVQNVDSYNGLYLNSSLEAGKTFTLSGTHTVDTSKDRALRIQTNDAGKDVPFYIGDILITAEIEEPQEIITYHETFDNGLGLITSAGNSKLTPVSDVKFEGNDDGYAVHVTERTLDYDGIDISFSSVGMENGKTYNITVVGYVAEDVDVNEGAAALVQNVDSYSGLYLNTSLEAGKAFTLKGTHIVDTSKDRALRIQTNDAGKDVPFYIGDILITTPKSSGEEEPGEERPPAKEFVPITFENQELGGFEGRHGDEILTITNEANRTEGGQYSLKVENRQNTWHGPSLRVEQYVDKGHEYKISAWVKLISPQSAQLQLSTQVGNGDGASYNNLQGKTISVDDGWVQLEGTYRYSSVGNEYLTIYVESNNSTASFYIDDITFEPTGTGVVDIERDLTPLKEAYEDYFLIGNAVSLGEFEGTRLELLKMHHNLISAENAMKPSYAYDEQGNFDFTAEDQLVQRALDEGFKIHGHVLVWHQQSREELHTDASGNPLSREEALENLETHVKTVVEHFGDSVISWDVVNEAMIDNPPTPSNWEASLRQSGWLKAIGTDYIEYAYRFAKEVIDENNWDIKLYYNDYNDDNQRKAEAIYNMVKEINEKYAAENNGELLIDGIGMQGHYNLNTNPENVKLSLERFISLGVEVGITELDITAGADNVLTEQQAQQQAFLYAQLFKLYKENAEHISRVTLWGLNDATSWRAAQSPLLFDRDLKAKPAYYAVIDPEKFIEEYDGGGEVIEANRGNALYGTPTVDAEIDPIWNDAPTLPINRYQMAWQGANGFAKALWDEENLYVLFQVSDSALDDSSQNPWEQDSVEIFVDENNAKTTFYQDDDGQYRVNFNNITSFNPEGIEVGFESATKVSGSGYTVEVKIPFKTITPEHNTQIGFDLQINDGNNGARQSIATWNDLTGRGFESTSVFGVLTLVQELDDTVDNENDNENINDNGENSNHNHLISVEGSTNAMSLAHNYKILANLNSSKNSELMTVSNACGGNGGNPPRPPGPGSDSNNNNDTENGNNGTIVPEVTTANNQVTGKVTAEQITQALANAGTGQNGKKQIVIELAKRANAQSYEVQLPAKSLQELKQAELAIKTEFATIIIPSDKLQGIPANAEQISIRVSPAATDHVDASAREKIGSRPAVTVNILTDNLTAASISEGAALSISIPYTISTTEQDDAESLVVWHIDENGQPTTIINGRYDEKTGTVTFQAPQSGSFAVAFVTNSFEDTAALPWAKKAIDAMAARDVIKGVSSSSYAPQQSINRADFITLLVRALELNAEAGSEAAFNDVQPSAYYYNELAIARSLGIASGYSDNSFRPGEQISRQDMMVLTVRALAAAGVKLDTDGSLAAFTDSDSLNNYAQDQAAALVKAGIINGKNGKIAPQDSLTRAEAAVILYRIWKL